MALIPLVVAWHPNPVVMMALAVTSYPHALMVVVSVRSVAYMDDNLRGAGWGGSGSQAKGACEQEEEIVFHMLGS